MIGRALGCITALLLRNCYERVSAPRIVSIAIALLVFIASGSAAQAPVRRNEHLRLELRDGSEIEGHLVRADSTSIVLWREPAGDTTAAPRELVSRIQRSTGTHKRTGKAAAVGAVIGAVAGAIAWNAQRQSDRANGGLLLPSFPYESFGALVGGAIGGILGALIGYQDIDDWEAVPLDVMLPM
jgi:hypothetical protein